MEPRNRVAKQAIPIEKNEVFLKKGGTAVEPCNRVAKQAIPIEKTKFF